MTPRKRPKRGGWNYSPPPGLFSENATARFDEKFIPEPNSGCWLWIGAAKHGYGEFMYNKKSLGAHRYSYERFVGPIPEGLHIDHLCRNTYCVNPQHLEPVTQGENTLRAMPNGRDTCKRGHPFAEANTYIDHEGFRSCRRCRAMAQSRYMQSLRGAK